MTPTEEFLQIQRDLLAETRAQRERTGDLAHALRFCGWVAAIGMILLLAFALKR